MMLFCFVKLCYTFLSHSLICSPYNLLLVAFLFQNDVLGFCFKAGCFWWNTCKYFSTSPCPKLILDLSRWFNFLPSSWGSWHEFFLLQLQSGSHLFITEEIIILFYAVNWCLFSCYLSPILLYSWDCCSSSTLWCLSFLTLPLYYVM
jgi:hypothetical protein